MCGRYYVDDETAKAIQKLVREVDARLGRERFGRDVHPTDIAPVVSGGGEGLQLSWQRWGFPGFKGKSVVFNARSETVMEKRMFWDGIRRHRVVVPGSWFYEWNRQKEKVTFLPSGSPALYMAGFCSRFEDGERFVILTTAANASMAATHDRMPLLLEERELRDWVLRDGEVARLLGKTPGPLEKRAPYEQRTLFESVD